MELRELLERMAGVEGMCDAARQNNDVRLLDRAIADARNVASWLTPTHPHYPSVSTELARCLSLRYRLTGAVSGLRESIEILRLTGSVTTPSDPFRVVYLNNLGNALADWHQLTGDRVALDEAETSFRAAISVLGHDDPRLATVLSGLGGVLCECHRVDGQIAALDEALVLARAAWQGMGPSCPGYPIAANNLARVLLEHYQVTAEPLAREEAVTTLRSALTLGPGDPMDRALLFSTLGTALMLEHEATGDLDQLDEAERALAEALTLAPGSDVARAGHLNTLGNVLADRYRRTGDRSALDRAAGLYREAVDATDVADVSYAEVVSNLANTLSERYELLGDLCALEEAVALLEHARNSVTEAHRGVLGSNLGAALLRMYQRRHDNVLLRQAIYALERALVGTAVRDVRRPMTLNNLGNALHEDYRLTGDPARLSEAERVYREAASTATHGGRARAMALSNLGNVLRDVWRASADPDALAAAVDVLRQAVILTERGHGPRGQALVNLGVALRELHEAIGEPALADEARRTFAEAAELPMAAPRTRVGAARAWGEMALGTHGGEALRAYQTAVELLPQVAPGQMSRSDQEYGLAGFVGLAADAAAVAVQNDDLSEALRLVDAARGILISRTMERQSDVTSLERHVPRLAQEFQELTRQLDSASPTSTVSFATAAAPGRAGDRHPAGYSAEIVRRTNGTRRWNHLLRRVREVPGFERFLLPQSASDLIDDVGEGPVVVLYTSWHRSDALVVLRGQTRAVPLPLLTPESVADQVIACFGAVREAHDPQASIAERRVAEDALSEILSWLWEAVGKPVMDDLAPHLSGATRVWWAPTGLMSFLPVHAAGRYDAGRGRWGESVLDCVVSSYTPTVRSLGHARRRSAAPTPSALVVGMPETPGCPPLPVAIAECEEVAALAGAGSLLLGEHATRQRLLEALTRHQLLHFAGHARGDLAAPSESRLLLHDHAKIPFTVADVAGLDLAGAELAFLSGCDTALSGIELADEAINLASAFHLAGFRHVVASLWSVDDRLASQIATPVWRSVRDHGSATHAAASVNQGVRALRDSWPRYPSAWAGYIHVGP